MSNESITISGAALGAILDEIEHYCNMLVLTDDETAAEDVEFYVPQIQRAADELRQLMRTAAPAQLPENNK